MELAQTNLKLGSARVPRALANVSFASRTAPRFHLFADAAMVRRETRRTATGTVALPKHCQPKYNNFLIVGAMGCNYGNQTTKTKDKLWH
jgi:hypothetical protein